MKYSNILPHIVILWTIVIIAILSCKKDVNKIDNAQPINIQPDTCYECLPFAGKYILKKLYFGDGWRSIPYPSEFDANTVNYLSGYLELDIYGNALSNLYTYMESWSDEDMSYVWGYGNSINEHSYQVFNDTLLTTNSNLQYRYYSTSIDNHTRIDSIDAIGLWIWKKKYIREELLLNFYIHK